jgi:hypothetical protein
MNILDFDQSEHEKNLDEVFSLEDEKSKSEFKKHLESSYNSLLFLGKNIANTKDPSLLESAIFNIRLLFVYYKRSEDYEKLCQLKNLAMILERPEESIVDASIIQEMVVNLN